MEKSNNKILKSELTKTSLIDGLITLVSEGSKADSVDIIVKKSKFAYGTFYRYFKNLDDINYQAITKLLTDGGRETALEVNKVKSHILKFYILYYSAVQYFSMNKNILTWLTYHPEKLNKTFLITEVMSVDWLNEAITTKENSNFTKENYKHYLKMRPYFFWTFQQVLQELISGNSVENVYVDLMNSINPLNLPKSIHLEYIEQTMQFMANQKNLIL